MIVDCYDDERAITEGCACCSRTLNIQKDEEEILEELKENLRLTKYVLEECYNIELEEFLKELWGGGV